jgi:hypothetical protein
MVRVHRKKAPGRKVKKRVENKILLFSTRMVQNQNGDPQREDICFPIHDTHRIECKALMLCLCMENFSAICSYFNPLLFKIESNFP